MTFNAASFVCPGGGASHRSGGRAQAPGHLPGPGFRGQNVIPARAPLLPARRDRRRHRADLVRLPAQRPGVLGRLHPGRVRPPAAAGRPAGQRIPARRGPVGGHEHRHFLCDQHELADLRTGDHGGHLRADGPAGGAELPLRRRRDRRRRRPDPGHRPHQDASGWATSGWTWPGPRSGSCCRSRSSRQW